MKTVSGTLVSMKVVSLSKAARVLSKFAFTDNGASPAFAAYLKRASASFDELVQIQKEIKGPGSERKDRKKKHPSSSGVVNEEIVNSVKGRSKDDFSTQGKQFSGGSKKHVDGDDVIAGNIVSSNGVEDNILKHDSNKDQKKKTEKDKEKNIDDASNRKVTEIDGLDVAKETKVKKKRDKGKKSDSDMEITVEEQSCPPSKDPPNQESTKVQENDGSEQSQLKKKKRMEHEKEDGYVIAKNQVDSENGERRKRGKKQNQGGERKSEGNDETQAANDISRKRKHKGNGTNERLDNSEEQHQSKKMKK